MPSLGAALSRYTQAPDHVLVRGLAPRTHARPHTHPDWLMATVAHLMVLLPLH